MDHLERQAGRCGKSCDSCLHRQELNCPGCIHQSPASLSHTCEIAQCCWTMNYGQCRDCQYFDGCYKRQKREQMAASTARQRRMDEERRTRLNARAREIGNKLWILFWLTIPIMIGNLLSDSGGSPIASVIGWVGLLVSFGCTLAQILILIRLGRVSHHYKISGWCSVGLMLLGALMIILGYLITDTGLASTPIIIVSLVDLSLSLLKLYHYYHGHMDILSGYDNNLQARWEQIWNWNLVCLLTFGGSIVFMFISVIASLLTLASSIGIIVLAVVEMVFLYKTAAFFHTYQQ